MADMALKRRSIGGLIAFIALVLGGGTAIGLATGPDAWFAALAKPSFNPPNWVFAPVWSTLYVMIGVAGWLVWTHAPSSLAMRLWWLQLVLNFCWSPAFFSLHSPGLALTIIVVLMGTIWAFVAATIRRLPTAALMFVPYGLWVLFATALNAALIILNRTA